MIVTSPVGDVTLVTSLELGTARCGWVPKWPFCRKPLAGAPRSPPVAQRAAARRPSATALLVRFAEAY